MASIAHPHPQAQAPAIAAPRVSETGLWSWLTTVDHKRIALLYGTTSFLLFLLGGLEALVIRTQLIRPENDVVSAQKYNELFTMHGTTMIFLVIMPLSVAFFNYIVPLQIGARDVAFPRLNAFSYWVFLAGAIILNLPMLASLPGTFAHMITGMLGAIGFHAFDGAAGWLNGNIPMATAVPDQGWYGYAPLTERLFSAHQIDFWALGIQVLGVSSVAGALNFIITIFNLRCPGMTMMRLPIFTWATLVTTILIVMAFPSITVGLALLTFDRFTGTHFFSAYDLINGQLVTAGGDPLLWQHLFWVFGHPEVYILILPAFGIVSEVIPVFSRKPLFGYAVMVYALAAIAFLGFGVWVHHMFTTGLGPTPDSVFAGSTMLIAIPTGVKIFNWLGTMWGGSLRFTTAMLFAIGLVSQFVIGGLSGVMHAVVPVDTQHNDSYFVVAHFHYVLFGGSMFALFAAMYYWWPKFTGRFLDEHVGHWHFWLTFAGFNLTFFPMHFLGLAGMPRRYATYGFDSGWWFWNVISTVGALLIGVSVLVFLKNISDSLRQPKTADDNPWDAATLEWATTSPPPPYNFNPIPVIAHRDPLWVAKYGRESHAREQELNVTVAGVHVATTQVPDESPAAEAARAVESGPGLHIHMPNPSYYPLLVAFGMFCAATGLLFKGPWLTVGLLSLPALSVLGLIITMASVIGWSFEPAG